MQTLVPVEFFNMSRSLQGYENILQQRTDSLWQIALGIVLCRHQTKNKCHVDLEQPRGSAYWKVPSTDRGLHTSMDLHVALHGKLRSGEHHHRPIAGNLKVNHQVMKVSKWTEIYPLKFARQVEKIMLHDSPLQYPVLVEDSEEHPTKRRRLGNKMSPAAIEARFTSDASDIS